MTLIYVLLLLGAALCFGFSLIHRADGRHTGLIALGLLLWVVEQLLQTAQALH